MHVGIIARHRHEVLIQLRDADALNAEHKRQLQALRQDVQDCWGKTCSRPDTARGELTRANRIVANGLLGMLNSVSQWYQPRRGQPASMRSHASSRR